MSQAVLMPVAPERGAEADSAAPAPAPAQIGWRTLIWLAAVPPLTALGLYLIALSYSASRAGGSQASEIYWAGLFAILAPIVVRLSGLAVSRPERIFHLGVLGFALTLVKLLQNPSSFTYHDELIHWSVTDSILATNRLYGENAILPVSPYYPGLHIVTDAFSRVSGLDLFASALSIVIVTRVLFVVVLFLLFEQIIRDARLAGLATLVYMGNPNFVYFGSMFAYETLALPLAGVVVLAVVRRQRATVAERLGLTAIALAAVAAVAMTHHLTTYALTGLLTCWSLVWLIRVRNSAPDRLGPANVTVLVVVVALTWLVYVATLTAEYLGSNLIDALMEMIRWLTGEVAGRQLFRDAAGGIAPLWDRVGAYLSVLVLLAALPLGVRTVWNRLRDDPLAVTLALVALVYPATLAMRLTSRGVEFASRSSEFVFLALGLVVGLAFAGRLGFGRFEIPERWRRQVTVVALTSIVAGGLVLGWPYWLRMPGPYLVSADARSIEPESLALTDWFRAEVDPGGRIAADRINRLLLTAYGRQRVITGVHDRAVIAPIFLADRLGPAELELIRRTRPTLLVIDRRLSMALPVVGVYFEVGEPGTYSRARPVSEEALSKFDAIPGVSRVFDSGHLQVYDVRSLADAR